MTESSALQARPHPGGTATFAGRTVSRIGFGAMQLDRLKDDRDSAIRVVRRAVELGVDHIDTAQFYGDGFVNGVLHDALQAENDVMVVTDRCRPRPGRAHADAFRATSGPAASQRRGESCAP